jgi:hypothetical protein
VAKTNTAVLDPNRSFSEPLFDRRFGRDQREWEGDAHRLGGLELLNLNTAVALIKIPRRL